MRRAIKRQGESRGTANVRRGLGSAGASVCSHRSPDVAVKVLCRRDQHLHPAEFMPGGHFTTQFLPVTWVAPSDP